MAMVWPNSKILAIGTRLSTVIRNIKKEKIQFLLPELVGGTQVWSWKHLESSIEFYNGSTISFGSTQSLDEFKKSFHGSSQDVIGVDDGGDIKSEILDYLPSINRLSADMLGWKHKLISKIKNGEIPEYDPDLIEPKMIITANPLGISHINLKEKYVDPWLRYCKGKGVGGTNVNRWKIPVKEPDGTYRRDEKTGMIKYQRKAYYPANVEDNPMLKGTSYHLALMTLPDRLKKGYLEGDWNVVSDSFFSFDEDIHIDSTINWIPEWKKGVALDYGFSDGYGVLFWQKNPISGDIQYIDEMHGRETAFADMAMDIAE